MKKNITKEEFNKIFNLLSEYYNVYAPVKKKGDGAFSNTDIIYYEKVTNYDDIEWNEKSTYSPKDIIFPISQTIMNFTYDQVYVPDIKSIKPIYILMRPCDINGIKRLDEIFLRNGVEEDFYYKRLREKVFFALIECVDGFENCFCVSMNANKSSDWDFAISNNKHQSLISIEINEVKNSKIKNIFESLFSTNTTNNNSNNSNNSNNNDNFEIFYPEKNFKKVTLPNVEEMPSFIYTDSKLWDEYKERCIACGRCNTTCVTCSCFSTNDLHYDDNPNVGERRRVWASCHIPKFSLMAGGHDMRKDNASRMRFKTFHKIYDYKKRFGEEKNHMCVGCGRCDDNCPEYISFSTIINKLSARLISKEKI
ncbi:MAG: anaerobic sulfite reductase subunit AsrA [Oligoflexia bacterium]|nr:anaerobic sulfite reductase subunit AsrA [Oligoflexia bacterium]